MNSTGISSELLMKSLSDDAKVLLGGYFGIFGMPGKSTLTFGMKKSRPTKRAQVALDELVKAGALSRRDSETGGDGKSWREIPAVVTPAARLRKIHFDVEDALHD